MELSGRDLLSVLNDVGSICLKPGNDLNGPYCIYKQLEVMESFLRNSYFEKKSELPREVYKPYEQGLLFSSIFR